MNSLDVCNDNAFFSPAKWKREIIWLIMKLFSPAEESPADAQHPNSAGTFKTQHLQNVYMYVHVYRNDPY